MVKEKELQAQGEEELTALLRQVKQAQAEFAAYTQEQVDEIFKAVALKAGELRIPLAEKMHYTDGAITVHDKRWIVE